ncbi:hypothetical protein KO528_15545 [Saccharophagus degradans]|uniref:immunity protein YezG family protein n=1 Tax=Saccharophagus degradans TaxID=86304 RepID=UPI001C09C7D6|nr:hypothetical protein [Saccharophagus degradans]MBU2986778.1 hypothetical protein [Saccharophagus degradans]
MFNNEYEIYQYLAENIVKAIPAPDWDKAEYIAMSQNFERHLIEYASYFKIKTNENFDFDLDEGSNIPATGYKISMSLFELHKKKQEDKPFNKYKFTLNNDGTFDIAFKYDEDFAYMKSLDADSDEFDDLLELDVTDQIESWEGLPQDHPRPWLHQ